MEANTSKLILITGGKTGLGRALAERLIKQRTTVIATSRQASFHEDLRLTPGEIHLQQLDVTQEDSILRLFSWLNSLNRPLDVLVNNAGIGYFGAVEESEDDEVRRMFEINFWGLTKMIQETLPVMRKQRSGHILNIASIGGLVGFPAVGFYNATKFAVDGLSESLSKEVAHLGIKVTIIAPSGFRTDWAGRSANDSKIVIEDYANSAAKNQATIRGYSGNQPGDPVKAAHAMVKVVETANPPLRLLLGAAALRSARMKIDLLKNDTDAWEETTVGADGPK